MLISRSIRTGKKQALASEVAINRILDSNGW